MALCIGIISDTHGYLDSKALEYFQVCDEIWHAGDLGPNIWESLSQAKPALAVYGNIDDAGLRRTLPEWQLQEREGMRIAMTHIAGPFERYQPEVQKKLKAWQPAIFICGHSHILKVQQDRKFNCLYVNPGAAGKHGFHHQRTLLRKHLENGRIAKMEAIDLGKRA
jgi:putative phosphoesterase